MIPYIFVDDDDDSLGNGDGAASSVTSASTSSSSPSCLLAKDLGSTPHMFLSYAKAPPSKNNAFTAVKTSFSTSQRRQQHSNPIGSHIIFNSTSLLSVLLGSETKSSFVDLEEADQDGTSFVTSNTQAGQDTGEASPQLPPKKTKTTHAHCKVDGGTNTDCQETFLKDLQLDEEQSKEVIETFHQVTTSNVHEDDENVDMIEGMSLEQQCARQKYEIAFLRAVVRELLVRNQVLTDKNKKMDTKMTNATLNSAAVDKMGEAVATTTDQELPDNGIPKEIEFHTEVVAVENNSLPMGTLPAAMQRLPLEETSHLTPSLGDFDHFNVHPFNLRPTPDLSNDDLLHDLGNPPHTAVYWNPSTALDLESPQAPTMTPNPPSQQAVVPVQHSETEDDIHVSPSSLILPTPSYPDMKAGEVLHHLARGIDLILYILKNDKNAKDFVKGRYTGRICEKSGLPQGNGVFRFERNGGFYAGSFHNGKLHGQGTLLVQDNQKWTKLRGTFQRNDFVGPSAIPTVQKQ